MSERTINAVVVNGRLGVKWEARVTKAQEAIILAVVRPMNIDPHDVAAYVADGDISHLEATTHDLLTKAVKQCQAKAPNASQARRYWPRKIASVILDNGLTQPKA